jgi:hypothetical protein
MAEVRPYHPDLLPTNEIKQADINIYNIGNNAEFRSFGAISKSNQI